MLTVVDRISLAAGAVAALTVVPAILLSAYEVLARYLFDSPTLWVFPTVIALCATSFVLAGSYVLQRRELIRVTVVYDRFGPRTRRVVDVASALAEVFWGGILTYAAGLQAYGSVFRVRGGVWSPERLSGAWSVPIPAVVRTVLFLACVLFLLQAIVNLARDLGLLAGRERRHVD
ncbi:MAG: TRAP transporter small permease subunit [Pseudomonadota bacterium]